MFYTNDQVAAKDPQFNKGEPLNHIGVVVDDLDEIEEKVIAEGLEPFSREKYDPRRAVLLLRLERD